MKNLSHIVLPLVAVLIAGVVLAGAGCSGGKSGPSGSHPVLVSVEISPTAAVPGESVTLVWRFEMADEWHLYWMGRNDSGYPPRIELDLPDGWVAGGLQWPVPERYIAPGDILDHVYFDELVLLQKIGAPVDALPDEEIVIKADVQWLACRDMCVPGRSSLDVTIPVRSLSAAVPDDPAAEAAFRLPRDLPPRTLETAWEGVTFHVHHPRAGSLTFMPTDDCGQLVDLLNDGQGDRLALRFKPKGGTVGPVRGLITIEETGGRTGSYRIDFPATALADAP
jgi:thiol:disulfide interchange protein DsbD